MNRVRRKLSYLGRKNVTAFQCCQISNRNLPVYHENIEQVQQKITLLFSPISCKNQNNLGEKLHRCILEKNVFAESIMQPWNEVAFIFPENDDRRREGSKTTISISLSEKAIILK